MHTVHVRVNDAATGQPTPCRVRFTGPDGMYYAPFGRQVEFANGWNEDLGGNLFLERRVKGQDGKNTTDARKYAFIDGTCEISLPGGVIRVEVHKGPEYKPIFQEINQPLGKMALRLTLERWIDLRAQGWYSGDTRCHWLTPYPALLEGAAEDLAVVNLLALEMDLVGHHHQSGQGSGKRAEYPAIPNLLAFSGQRPALEMPGTMVVVNTQNHHGRIGELYGWPGALGQLSLLNCHRIVYPLRFGSYLRPVGDSYEQHERLGWDNWTLASWCDQCHRKGGLVIWSGSEWRSEDARSLCGETLADLILGRVDAYEVSRSGLGTPFTNWYHLLNCGLRVPLVGACDKQSNSEPLGLVRTYARLGEGDAFSYGNWIEAIRAGRTFVTLGPLLTFTVNGQEPGSVIQLSGPGNVRVRVEARGLEPFESLEVLANGEVAKSIPCSGTPAAASLDDDVRVQEPGWIAVRCRWKESPFVSCRLPHAAHSSPVYTLIAGRSVRPKAASVAVLDNGLGRMQEWVQSEARCETDQQRENLIEIFREAREELAKRVNGR